jgi:hypothetical protein
MFRKNGLVKWRFSGRREWRITSPEAAPWNKQIAGLTGINRPENFLVKEKAVLQALIFCVHLDQAKRTKKPHFHKRHPFLLDQSKGHDQGRIRYR